MTTYILTRDLLAAGNSDKDLAHLVRTRELEHLRRGAYTEPAELELEQRHRLLLESTMAMSDGRSVVSFGSAAVVHDLPVFASSISKVHLTRSRTAGGRKGAIVHQHVAKLGDADVCEVDGLLVTTMARTVVDLARTVPLAQGVAAGDRALRLGLELAALAAQLESAKGRHGIDRARRGVALLDRLSESAGESISRILLHSSKLPHPELQVRLFDPKGRFVARPDFLWRDHGVVGEFDGKIKYHKLLRPGETITDVVLREKQREERMRELGLIVIRWVWDDLYHRPEELLERILHALKAGTPFAGRTRMNRPVASSTFRSERSSLPQPSDPGVLAAPGCRRFPGNGSEEPNLKRRRNGGKRGRNEGGEEPPGGRHSGGDQAHRLGAGDRIPHHAADSARDRLGAGLLHPAHDHALVFALQYDDHAARFERLDQFLGDLGREPFLDLRPLGVDVDEPGQFGQASDAAVLAGDVADVGDTGEGQQMMLADAPDLDVLDQDQLVVAEIEGGRQHLGRVLVQAGQDLGVRLGHPFRGVPQTIAVRILTDPDQQLPDGPDDPIMIELV